ncbi:serine/threonine-protein phosphatase with EF-hands 2 [Oncorhynchus mykiss]|uniref:serine/threonine-protein phosphatase with EF-hands 2 n=1 Tax=Oncorhynchus mykiss TaxID=8022 RepID=UPI0018777844|nr:serine/threonine-protein phosphatase with EF-hands 2 [Oncorhynchus mykiss]
MRAALLIQRWYRQYVARLEMRRRCTWNIFQSIEYAGEQDQIKLYNFFGYLMDHFTPASSERNLISHIFRENNICRNVDWERYFCYKSIEVPKLYSGPHLSFPITCSNAAELVEAFKNKQQLHSRYVLQLLGETWRLLRILPNISQISTCHSKEITICALRPPKRKRQNRSGMTDSDLEDDDPTAKPVDSSRRRVHSLTHSSSTGTRHEVQRRSLQGLNNRVTCSVEEELKERRRQAGLSQSYGDLRNSLANSDSDPDSGELLESYGDEWKQIVDMLWSDPMPQDGCVPNEVRGGGCYWGPDVTEEVLRRHNLTLLIRSHECKQEGYEFCHNRRVLTIFSASNYYEVGSNRGAYIRMGPDLVPHFIQYQANRATRALTLRQSVGRTERSALRALREKLFAHKSDLISSFQEYDPENTGLISLGHWACAMEAVLRLGLPWRVLRTQLVGDTLDGMLDYHLWFRELSITEPNTEVSLLETMYKHHSNLETIFRIIDTDNSGLISFEEFRQTWKLLSSHLQTEISDEAISDLAVSIDFNKDGSIDINEFMEAFRLVGGDLLQNEGDPH